MPHLFTGDATGATNVLPLLRADMALHPHIEIPPGRFLISGGVYDWGNIPANCRITGAGDWRTGFEVRGPCRFLAATNAPGIHLEGFTIDMGGTKGSAALYFGGPCPAVRLNNLRIINGETGLSFETGCHNANIVDNVIADMPGHGMVFTESHNVAIKGNRLRRIGQSGVQMFLSGAPLIKDNFLEGAGINNGYGGVRLAVACYDARVAHNAISNFSRGVFTIGLVYGQIESNNISDSKAESIFVEAKADVQGNRVSQVVNLHHNNIKNGAADRVAVVLERNGADTFCANHLVHDNNITAQAGPMLGGFRDHTADRQGEPALWGGASNEISTTDNKVNGCPFWG